MAGGIWVIDRYGVGKFTTGIAGVKATWEKITVMISNEGVRKSDRFTALRKALRYGWSVAVAAQPVMWKVPMEKWVQAEDR